MPPLLIINKDPKNKNKTYDGLIPIFFDIISSHYNIRWIKKYIAILAYLFINPTRQFNFQIPIYSCDLHSRWRTQPKYYRPIWKKSTFLKYLKHAYGLNWLIVSFTGNRLANNTDGTKCTTIEFCRCISTFQSFYIYFNAKMARRKKSPFGSSRSIFNQSNFKL